MQRSRQALLTLNNPPEDWKSVMDNLFVTYKFKYLAGQLEKGKQGTLHIQMYCYSSNQISIKKLSKEKLHVNLVFKDNGASSYVLKEDTRIDGPYILGIPPIHGGDHKSITFRDLQQATQDQIMEMTPYMGLQALKIQQFLPQQPQDNLDIEFPWELYYWQEQLLRIFELPSQPRKIIWFVDLEGNTGKTCFAMKYCEIFASHTLYMEPAKKQDMLYNVKPYHDTIFIDISRSNKEIDYLYGVLESIKNGWFLSTKYVPKQIKLSSIPHVVVLSNTTPDYSKLSMDRWDVRDMKFNSIQSILINSD